MAFLYGAPGRIYSSGSRLIVNYTIGGTISGLEGSGLVLQNNGGDDETITANGDFTFDTALADGSGYVVTVKTQPSDPVQTCSVSSGSGTLDGENIKAVSVECFTLGEVIFSDGFE